MAKAHRIPPSNFRHGHKTTSGASPEYNSWCSMVARCTNQRRKDFKYYGGRGITVCDRWRLSFVDFLADVGPRPGKRHWIDRIDNAGNYEPGNVRWATVKEQQNNRRSRRLITYRGRTQTLQQWADETGINRSAILVRIDKYHWPIEEALGFVPHVHGHTRLNAEQRDEHRQARQAVQNAVKRGKLPPPGSLLCRWCGKPAIGYHHHLGYSHEHWFDILPLCASCHGKR